jgi:hypothetical protein
VSCYFFHATMYHIGILVQLQSVVTVSYIS